MLSLESQRASAQTLPVSKQPSVSSRLLSDLKVKNEAKFSSYKELKVSLQTVGTFAAQSTEEISETIKSLGVCILNN
jgi:hypothetical protein